MVWETLLDNIREGKIPIETGKSGVPSYVADAPLYERMEFMKALVKGYMVLYARLKVAKQFVRYHEKKEEEQK